MATENDDERLRRLARELMENRDTLSDEERQDRIKQTYEVIKSRINSRSDEEKERIRVQVFGESFGKAGPIRQTKSSERVVVPRDLRDYLIDVQQRILEGDEAATIPSDDLLQCENVYGGLDRSKDRYSFVYFPDNDRAIRWQFTLLPSEIEEIASGWTTEMTVLRLERVSG